MFAKAYSDKPVKRQKFAALFAALGDETRLLLIAKLAESRRLSIYQLTVGTKLTRQAVTKHLRLLEESGLVHGARQGRENCFELDPGPFKDIKQYLDFVSTHWESALSRLKVFVEN